MINRGLNNKKGRIIAVSISRQKGTKKRNVNLVELRENWGIIGDAHTGNWHRQVSLLSIESIEKVEKKGLDVSPGDFAENITTKGLELPKLNVGTKLKLGEEVILEVTQIGKTCHTRCPIYYKTGDCVMPREGIFTKVIKGGIIQAGDEIVVLGGEDVQSSSIDYK